MKDKWVKGSQPSEWGTLKSEGPGVLPAGGAELSVPGCGGAAVM